MDRINIIEDDEFVLAMAAAGKKGKGKKKATGGSASSPPKSQKASGVPTAREKGKAAAAQNTGARFYEADGLKIPLFDSAGRKRISRSWKTISKKNFEELLEIVEEYAGANKKEGLRNRGSSKTEFAQWIEAQETLAFKHDPKTIIYAQQDNAEHFGHRAPTFASSASSPTKKANKPTVARPIASAKDAKSQIAAKEDGMCHHPVDKKRRAPEVPAYGEPHQKHQKRDHEANLQTTSTGTPAKDNHTDKQDYDVIPTPSQTGGQTATYNNTDDDAHHKVTFMNDTDMHPDDADRSSMIVRGGDEDQVLTATKRTKNDGTDRVTLHQVSVPHNADPSAVVQHIVPYLKEGKHGPGGDFDLDPDRATGKGHNYHPGDAKLYQEYLEQRAAFRKLHPTYPKLKEGEHVDDEMKADRDMWETWYYGFREKYPGTRGDQWVCGCSALIEESGDESEEE